ncbi:MAG TPA: terminase family protein [Bryobacteraceae bacterium]|jgi:hypothetical protein
MRQTPFSGNWREIAIAAASPLEFARKFLDFFPDEAQARVLDRAPDFRQIALNCSRQWGKSTVAAVLATHRLVVVPRSTVLIVGPTGRQSSETLLKVSSFLNTLAIKTRGDGANRHAMLLPNGSRIVGLPAVEGTIRGFSAVSMLIVDEASRVPDEVYQAVRPSLATSNGDVILLSTPKGKRGFFYREMTEGERWLRHTGPVTECKRITERFIDEERSRGDAYFQQEYLCEFIDTGKYLFDEALVKKMINPNEQAWRWL